MLNSVSTQKQSLRKALSQQFKSYSSLQLNQWALLAQEQVLRSEVFIKAQSIGLYQSVFQEVQTDIIFEKSHHKKYAYPKVNDKEGPLSFFWVETKQQFKKSKWGILEPDENMGARKAAMDDIDLMIIPGLAFDRSGFRLGRGKGFYDKTLKQFSGQRVGLAYSFQVLDQLPHEEWDEKVNWLVTETEWLKV